MKEKYFRLFPHCEIVQGPVRTVVYDLMRGRAIHLNTMQSLVVNQCEMNVGIDEIQGVDKLIVENTIEEFYQEHLGMYYPGPVYVEKLKLNSSIMIPGFLEPPVNISLAYIQLSSACNLHCRFCGTGEAFPWLGCNSCLRWSASDKLLVMDLPSINKIISELCELETQNIHFSGGNPLLHKESLTFAILQIREQQHLPVGIRIHSNGTLIDKEFLKFITEVKAEFVFSNFGDCMYDYDVNCGEKEAFISLQETIQTCKELGIPFTNCVVLPPNNSIDWIKKRTSVTKRGETNPLFTEFVVLKDGRPSQVASVPVNTPRDDTFTKEYYFYRKANNVCMNGTMAIGADLQLHPCPMFEGVADLKIMTIHDAIKEQVLKQYWKYTKAQVPVCNTCEFRNICSDCSFIEQLSDKKPELKDSICGYNPATGRWPAREIPAINSSEAA